MIGARQIQWKAGYPARIPVEDAYAELELIRSANNGELTTDIVVERARDKKNVLHPQVFDLPQKAAAEQYYKSRAALMIRCVMVRFEDGPEEPVRMYQVIREEQSEVAHTRTAKIYGDIEDALSDPEQRQFVLDRALADVARWREKYAALSELAEIFTVVDNMIGN
jgi:flagellar motility protein MotE (MotC chaperone)